VGSGLLGFCHGPCSGGDDSEVVKSFASRAMKFFEERQPSASQECSCWGMSSSHLAPSHALSRCTGTVGAAFAADAIIQVSLGSCLAEFAVPVALHGSHLACCVAAQLRSNPVSVVHMLA